MRQLFIISTFLLTSFLNGQEIKKGLILPDEGFDVCCYYIPTSGLTIYNQPNGTQVGNLTLVEPDNNGESYSASIQINDEQRKFSYKNFEMVGYETMAMTFKNASSNYVQLNNGYWLSVDELTSKQLKLTSWLKYIIEKETEWYANDPGLNLKESPSSDSKIIARLKGDLWGLTPTNETNGNWCKVTVTHYREHPCSGNDNLVIETFTGWIELISTKQTPNVWNYGKGC